MDTKEFPEVNLRIAEDQEEYGTLPAHVSEQGIVTCCFSPSEEELKQINETGEIWLSVMTFLEPLQPVMLTAECPLEKKEANNE